MLVYINHFTAHCCSILVFLIPGVAITPTSSIPVTRGFNAVVTGTMVLMPECSTRTTTMATTTITTVFVLPCRRSPSTRACQLGLDCVNTYGYEGLSPRVQISILAVGIFSCSDRINTTIGNVDLVATYIAKTRRYHPDLI